MLEISSAVFGVTGSLLLAIKSRYAGLAFVLYTLSNLGWIAFSAINKHWGALAQNGVFWRRASSGYGCGSLPRVWRRCETKNRSHLGVVSIFWKFL